MPCGINRIREGTPETKPNMENRDANAVLQVNTDLTVDSDRVKSPEVNAGPMDFRED